MKDRSIVGFYQGFYTPQTGWTLNRYNHARRRRRFGNGDVIHLTVISDGPGQTKGSQITEREEKKP